MDQIAALRVENETLREENRQLKAARNIQLSAVDGVYLTLQLLVMLTAIIRSTRPCSHDYLRCCIGQFCPDSDPSDKALMVSMWRLRRALERADPPFDGPTEIMHEALGYYMRPEDRRRIIRRLIT